MLIILGTYLHSFFLIILICLLLDGLCKICRLLLTFSYQGPESESVPIDVCFSFCGKSATMPQTKRLSHAFLHDIKCSSLITT